MMRALQDFPPRGWQGPPMILIRPRSDADWLSFTNTRGRSAWTGRRAGGSGSRCCGVRDDVQRGTVSAPAAWRTVGSGPRNSRNTGGAGLNDRVSCLTGADAVPDGAGATISGPGPMLTEDGAVGIGHVPMLTGPGRTCIGPGRGLTGAGWTVTGPARVPGRAGATAATSGRAGTARDGPLMTASIMFFRRTPVHCAGPVHYWCGTVPQRAGRDAEPARSTPRRDGTDAERHGCNQHRERCNRDRPRFKRNSARTDRHRCEPGLSAVGAGVNLTGSLVSPVGPIIHGIRSPGTPAGCFRTPPRTPVSVTGSAGGGRAP
jgi:hypothetical protein